MYVSVWDLNTAEILPTVIIVTINPVNLGPFSTVVNLIYIYTHIFTFANFIKNII